MYLNSQGGPCPPTARELDTNRPDISHCRTNKRTNRLPENIISWTTCCRADEEIEAMYLNSTSRRTMSTHCTCIRWSPTANYWFPSTTRRKDSHDDMAYLFAAKPYTSETSASIHVPQGDSAKLADEGFGIPCEERRQQAFATQVRRGDIYSSTVSTITADHPQRATFRLHRQDKFRVCTAPVKPGRHLTSRIYEPPTPLFPLTGQQPPPIARSMRLHAEYEA